MVCGLNFAYLPADCETFSLTEYKILRSQENSIFVPVMKLLYNGRIQLYYRTEGYRSLDSCFSFLDAGKFLEIVFNLLSAVLQTGGSGFLSCRKIAPAFDKIFLEADTCRVRLVYLPVSGGFFPDEAAFETQLRSGLVRVISECGALGGSGTDQLAADLSDGLLSLEKLAERLRGNIAAPDCCAPSLPEMRLAALNAPGKVTLYVNKDSYVIGKNPAAADGVLSFNTAISRVHCRIVKTGTQYRVEDLGSSNGTWVNRVRVRKNRPLSIRDGDILRLANTDLRVMIQPQGM